MSKKRVILVIGVALVVLVAGLVGAAFVLAQEVTTNLPFSSLPVPFAWRGGGFGRQGGFPWAGSGQGITSTLPFGRHAGCGMMGGFEEGHEARWAMFDAAAEAAGMTPEELFAELRAGKSPEEIAQERGVELEEVYKTALAQAVEDGYVTQEQADQMLQAREQGLFPPQGGFGWHAGRGMMGGSAEADGAARWAMFDAVAEALGMTPEELFTEFRAGKSPEEIVQEQGVEMEEIYKAVITQAVEEGYVTQDQADWLFEGLERGLFPRHGLDWPGGGGKGSWGSH